MKKKQRKKWRTTLEPIRIIKQLNANLTEGKPGKKKSNLKKNISSKKGKKNKANLGKPSKSSSI